MWLMSVHFNKQLPYIIKKSHYLNTLNYYIVKDAELHILRNETLNNNSVRFFFDDGYLYIIKASSEN